jgi:sulfur dioxygenase
MLLRQLFDADTWTYTYLVADEGCREALLIDPVRDRVDRDLALLKELDLRLSYALDTHVHADHLTGAGLLRERTGCKTVAGLRGPDSIDLKLPDAAKLLLGTLEVEVLATPGHTDDSVSYRVGEHVFTGDALLVRGTGRTDFQNGDAGLLYDAITKRLFSLPDSTKIWPGHDYRGHTASTVGEEKRHNPRLAGKSREQFIELMGKLGLAPPKYIQQAVPANRELGLGTGPEQSSGRFTECDGTEVTAMLGTVRVIDVREPHELGGELGVIPGALNVPMGRFPDAAASWARDAPLLVVCRSGRRSREVCEKLADLGFTAVTNLRGGMLDYRERGQRS